MAVSYTQWDLLIFILFFISYISILFQSIILSKCSGGRILETTAASIMKYYTLTFTYRQWDVVNPSDCMFLVSKCKLKNTTMTHELRPKINSQNQKWNSGNVKQMLLVVASIFFLFVSHLNLQRLVNALIQIDLHLWPPGFKGILLKFYVWLCCDYVDGVLLPCMSLTGMKWLGLCLNWLPITLITTFTFEYLANAFI